MLLAKYKKAVTSMSHVASLEDTIESGVSVKSRLLTMDLRRVQSLPGPTQTVPIEPVGLLGPCVHVNPREQAYYAAKMEPVTLTCATESAVALVQRGICMLTRCYFEHKLQAPILDTATCLTVALCQVVELGVTPDSDRAGELW